MLVFAFSNALRADRPWPGSIVKCKDPRYFDGNHPEHATQLLPVSIEATAITRKS